MSEVFQKKRGGPGTNPNSLANLKKIEKGTVLNPGGKPVGARNRLQGAFINALADDFDKHGKTAIVTMRENDPGGYVRAVASLMPKELKVEHVDPFEGMNVAEIAVLVDALRAEVDAIGSGPGVHKPEQAGVVPPLH